MKLREAIALDNLSLPGDDGFVKHSGESDWEAIVSHNSFDIEDEGKAEKLIDAYLRSKQEGKEDPGTRDGTGPARRSYQRKVSNKGKRGGPYPGCDTDKE
jgi:hypothetical protein